MNTSENRKTPNIHLKAVVLDCPDVKALASFYTQMLGWEERSVEEDFIAISSKEGGIHISFQTNALYVPPVWPEEMNSQQQMLHLDFYVDTLEEMKMTVDHAIHCGARKAPMQYSDEWTVMFDPVGHPFCIIANE